MLSNYTFDSLQQGHGKQSIEIERPIPIIESIQKIYIFRNMNVILSVLDDVYIEKEQFRWDWNY